MDKNKDAKSLVVAYAMNGVVIHQAITEKMKDVIATIYKNNADVIVVMNEGIPIGMITEKEIFSGIAKHGSEFFEMNAVRIMKDLLCITHNSELLEAKSIMIQNGIGILPVVKDNEVIGALTQRDMISYLFI